MTKILHIDTAGQFCSIALSMDSTLLGLRQTNEKNAHARVLTLFIRDVLTQNCLSPKDLDAVAVSMGPGSYTGLRIGVSTAKGLCYAIGKPLIAVATLQSMALESLVRWKKMNVDDPDIVFCPMIDARRIEVYSALFDKDGTEIRETRAEIINENSYREFLSVKKVVFSGNGSYKCKPLLSACTNAFFIDNCSSSAKYMIPIALEKFNQRQFEDVAYFEPFYLKDFVAAPPKVKGLR